MVLWPSGVERGRLRKLVPIYVRFSSHCPQTCAFSNASEEQKVAAQVSSTIYQQILAEQLSAKVRSTSWQKNLAAHVSNSLVLDSNLGLCDDSCRLIPLSYQVWLCYCLIGVLSSPFWHNTFCFFKILKETWFFGVGSCLKKSGPRCWQVLFGLS